jgi:hypothetical protein
MIIPELSERYIDFIGFYENVFPQGFCQHVINEYDIVSERGLCGTRKSIEHVNKHFKSGSMFFLDVNDHESSFSPFHEKNTRSILQNGLQRCFDAYTDQYDILKDMVLHSTHIKIQRTNPGEGYHVWHCEQNNLGMTDRCLVWAIYLNDIDEAGETEFLYQQLRVPPKENTCMIFPAAYTHTHRGNVVHGEKSKYIVTGWFYLE